MVRQSVNIFAMLGKRKESGQPEKKVAHPLKVGRVDTDDPDYVSEVPKHLRNEYFPGFPSTSVFVGKPGSGKTNVLIFMLLNEVMWNKFFDKIYLCGPTCKSDKMYERISVPEDQICTEQKEFLPFLEEIIEKQQKDVESNKKDADKILVVFEDITSFYHKVQTKPEFARCYTQVRHLKGASVAMVHKWKAFNRTARMATQHILVWKINRTDQKQLYDDFGPTSMSLKDWYRMMDYCHTPTDDDPKPFLYINTTQPEEKQFRKNFTEILNLTSFNKKAKFVYFLQNNIGVRGVTVLAPRCQALYRYATVPISKELHLHVTFSPANFSCAILEGSQVFCVDVPKT